jgi:hypothetical protein
MEADKRLFYSCSYTRCASFSQTRHAFEAFPLPRFDICNSFLRCNSSQLDSTYPSRDIYCGTRGFVSAAPGKHFRQSSLSEALERCCDMYKEEPPNIGSTRTGLSPRGHAARFLKR